MRNLYYTPNVNQYFILLYRVVESVRLNLPIYVQIITIYSYDNRGEKIVCAVLKIE